MSKTNDWHLREWMRHLGKKQVALVNELGWDKARANFVWHGKTPYRREIVNEIATWLGIEPYELMMTPKMAAAFKSLRRSAEQIVAEADSEFEHAPAPLADRRK